MKTKVLFFALIAISLFSCKKKNASPSLEQLQQQILESARNGSSAEQLRLDYYKQYATLRPGSTSFKGNIKTLLSYDSLKTERSYQAYNQAGYLMVDSTYRSNRLSSVQEVTYDNNNFILLDISKRFSNNVINDQDSIIYTTKNAEVMVAEGWTNYNGIWIGDSRHAYTYASKGKVATDTIFEWNRNRWEYDEVIVNTYQNGNLTQTTTSPITAAVNVGNPNNKSTYEYDAKGNAVVIRQWEDDGVGLVLENTFYNEITYW